MDNDLVGLPLECSEMDYTVSTGLDLLPLPHYNPQTPHRLTNRIFTLASGTTLCNHCADQRMGGLLIIPVNIHKLCCIFRLIKWF